MQRTTKESEFLDKEERLRRLCLLGLAGDARAYHDFLKALGAHLRAYFRKRLFQIPDEVEDLVQETLLAIHTKRHTYRHDQPLTAWVHGIARYKLIDMLHARRGRENLNDPLEDDVELFASSDTDASDAQRDLEGLLQGLPDKQRLPIVHMKLEGLSVIETARRTGLSESAVKVGVHRGLKALAAKLRSQP